MVVNQLQRVLETANLKLASVATDVTGVSARAMLEQIVAGQADPAVMAALARGRMRSKQEELKQALTGRVREHHRFLIGEHLTHIDFLDERITAFDDQIDRHLNPPDAPPPAPTPPLNSLRTVTGVPFPKAIELLDSIPGVNKRVAEVLMAEIGTDMSRFPSAHHLASWAGLCPGNNRSANQQRSGRIAPGSRPIRTSLVQAAQAAAHTKDTYLSAQYHRLVVRRGQQKAIIAIAHSILVSAYYILLRQEPYRDLGGNYFDLHQKEAVTHHLVKRLEKLGFEVTLEPTPLVS
jgi:transposase